MVVVGVWVSVVTEAFYVSFLTMSLQLLIPLQKYLSYPLQSARTQIIDFHMISGYSTDHPLYFLQQHRPRTPAWSLVAGIGTSTSPSFLEKLITIGTRQTPMRYAITVPITCAWFNFISIYVLFIYISDIFCKVLKSVLSNFAILIHYLTKILQMQ